MLESNIMLKTSILGIALTLAMGMPGQIFAQGNATDDKQKSEAAPIEIKVADGKMTFTAPGSWEKVTPKSNMLDAEFKVPRKGTDPADGRMTLMSAGGSVQANIDRWKGQFSGEKTAKIDETTVAGQKVHMVNIVGTFMESSGGPFGPKTKRENYRMLAAIVEYGKAGKYFIKLTGPKETLDANKDQLRSSSKASR